MKESETKEFKKSLAELKTGLISIAAILNKHGRGELLNAATLFFADEPMELRCAVFGTTTSSMIIDRHDIRGAILELIEEAQKYILKNIHIGMRLDGLYRKDVPEISVDALREAIINAFCHRDILQPGKPVYTFEHPANEHLFKLGAKSIKEIGV